MPAKSPIIIRGAAAIGEYLSTDERTVLGLIREGELPAFPMGGAWCISRETLRAYVKSLEKYCQGEIIKLRQAEQSGPLFAALKARFADMRAAAAELPPETPEKKADREERVRRTRAIRIPTEEEIRAKVAARRKGAAD